MEHTVLMACCTLTWQLQQFCGFVSHKSGIKGLKDQSPVVQKADNPIQWINFYPADKW